jgi:hypothetical protein
MAIIGTPVPTVPDDGRVVCSSLSVVPQQVTLVEGTPNPTKPGCFVVPQSQPATLEWTVRDPVTGCVVDLTTCGGPVRLRLREALSIGNRSSSGTQLDTTPTDPENGVIQVDLPLSAVFAPGVSKGEFGVFNADERLLFVNQFYLVVNRSVWAEEESPTGPPTMDEIRLHLRDTSAADNLWLAVQEFDGAEIAECIVRPVAFFNEAQPPLDRRYNTCTFPWRHNWLDGTVACLYQMASLHYARVHLPYSAGGTQIDDKNKVKEYVVVAQQKWEVFTKWVQWQKVQINALGAYQTTGSLYDGIRYGGW